jgi:hypothetical protein
MGASERQVVVANLKLNVFLRALHPEFFSIRARKSFRQGDYFGEVWLLDVGHVITFIDGEDAVTETIAPRELELPKRGLARSVDIVGEHEHRLEARGPLVYHMAYQVDTQNPETYAREAAELLAAAEHEHLVAQEPRDAARNAFSYAVSEFHGRGLLVHTWHGFPAESTILRTQTLVERLVV